MQSYAPYQRTSGLRRRGVAFDGMQPGAALHAYVTALDVTTEAVVIIDRTGNIVYANAASDALFGCGSLVGRHLSELYPFERRALRTILGELRRNGVWRADMRDVAVHLDRTDQGDQSVKGLDVAVALRSVAFAPGRSHHFCLVARPLESAESSAISAVARVAGEIAHDFNNQIAVVLNYSFILLRQLPDDSPLRAHVAEMQSAAWRASQVAQEMLGFGGQRRAESDEIDLNALLGDVKALFTYALREDTLLEQQLDRDLWRVRARRAHLEWLLVELASRMRATMGPIARFVIATANSDVATTSTSLPDLHDGHGTGAQGERKRGRSVVISVEAQPRKTRSGLDTVSVSRIASVESGGEFASRWGAGFRSGLSALGSANTSGSSGMRGAELALAHARGELAVQQLPDGGMRYRIRLPAV